MPLLALLPAEPVALEPPALGSVSMLEPPANEAAGSCGGGVVGVQAALSENEHETISVEASQERMNRACSATPRARRDTKPPRLG
jgi:hypothetical protein